MHRDAAKAQYLDRLIVVIGVQQKQFDALYRVWREYMDRRRGAIQDEPPMAPGVPPFPGVLPLLPANGPGMTRGPEITRHQVHRPCQTPRRCEALGE